MPIFIQQIHKQSHNVHSKSIKYGFQSGRAKIHASWYLSSTNDYESCLNLRISIRICLAFLLGQVRTHRFQIRRNFDTMFIGRNDSTLLPSISIQSFLCLVKCVVIVTEFSELRYDVLLEGTPEPVDPGRVGGLQRSVDAKLAEIRCQF